MVALSLNVVAPLFLAIALSVLHFFSEEYSGKIEGFHSELVSFSAGLFITFIFLDLLPEFLNGLQFAGENIFLALLLGFVVFHMGEKYIYQHITNKRELLKDLTAIHALGFFFDHFTVGVALFLVFSVPIPTFGLLLFIPLLLHTVSSSLSLSHLDEVYRRKSVFGFLLPLSPVIGVLAAWLLNPTTALYYILFSIVVGALLYVVIRDMIPSGKKGDLPAFIIGFIVSLAILLFVRLV